MRLADFRNARNEPVKVLLESRPCHVLHRIITIADSREEHEERLLALHMVIEGGVQERGDIFKAAISGEDIEDGAALTLIVGFIRIDKRSIEEIRATLFHADPYRCGNF